MAEQMTASVHWQGRMTFSGTATTGFEVPLGAAPEVGGDNDGFRPLELFAIGLAGCTAMDVISILRKKRQEISLFEVQVQADRADDHPRVFTHLQVTYIFHGKNIDAKAVERAIELSEETYCPAQGMLKQVAKIESTYTIHEDT